MKTEKKFPQLSGVCEIISDLSLEDLALKISSKLFGGLFFEHGERSIWEEMPAVYINGPVLGMLVILGGYGREDHYFLDISPWGEYSRYIYSENLRKYEFWMFLDYYIYYLLKQTFENDPEIQIIEPTMNRNSELENN